MLLGTVPCAFSSVDNFLTFLMLLPCLLAGFYNLTFPLASTSTFTLVACQHSTTTFASSKIQTTAATANTIINLVEAASWGRHVLATYVVHCLRCHFSLLTLPPLHGPLATFPQSHKRHTSNSAIHLSIYPTKAQPHKISVPETKTMSQTSTTETIFLSSKIFY